MAFMLIEWIATALTVAGYTLLSIKALTWGFVVSAIGSIFWIVWAYSKKAHGIILVNLMLLAAGINGVLS